MGCCSSTKADKQVGNVATLLPKLVSAPRSLARFQEPIQSITLHEFGDESEHGVGAVVMAVVQQASGVTQGLVAAKARLAKKGLTIPCLHGVSVRPHDRKLSP